MEERDITCIALLSAQRGLLGVITPNVRHISMEWEGAEVVRFRVCYEIPPTEAEIEDMDSVATEVLCTGLFNWQEQIDIIVSAEPMENLKFLKYSIYRRKEPMAVSSKQQ